ncbi:Berberine bridge enzyme-like 8 [Citrus sinensis]|uniref:Berberine bridge enzyme-like 8 n=1 Tax=Citrus sinensis TaxID=2711 RepID=A0ACB8HRT6_CITSI|nr:tetrahydrocannabinolic acid synthase [Citrus x clementina]KAH9677514.1 Berberine bridge enzyme-like 8 [Citrus sinensis]
MKPQITKAFPSTLVLVLSFFHGIALAHDTNEKFLQCLSVHSESTFISKVTCTQNNSSYISILNSLKQNLLYKPPEYGRPQVIVTPFDVSQIQAVLKCAQKHDLLVKVRSGGHDHEGLSYLSEVPFVMIDMINFSQIDVDAEAKTAWVGAGATLGELYYKISEKSKNLAFPAGICPTVAVGGHLSGGGFGYIMRKYGLGADQVIDAHLVDVNGRILDRKSMGEDLFWAIRGGGAASFGVLVAWKVNLVDVPSIVTVFTVQKTLEQNASQIHHKWQQIAYDLPKELVISAGLQSQKGKRALVATFSAVYLGGVDRLLPLMQERFPELGLVKEDCQEMSWVESTVYHFAFEIRASKNLELLLDRVNYTKYYLKAKSDYVREPIPVEVLEGMYEILYEEGGHNIYVISFPYGGRLNEIPETEIAFPHRTNKFHMMYFAAWSDGEESQKVLELDRKLYEYMTPYVTKNPRATYFNCKDIEIGRNNYGNNYTSVKEASIWGKKYFKNNFYRLVDVKTKVDPGNFFRNEQSIPSRIYRGIKKKHH